MGNDLDANISINRLRRAFQTLQDGKRVNVDIGEVDVVKDRWKINNPPKSK